MATKANIKSPPVFKPEEDDDYASWRNDLEVWKDFTDTKPEKLGLAVYLSLEGRAREAVRGLKSQDLKVAGGFALIVGVLDKVFLTDETSRAFVAFKDFYEYRRASGVGFSEFIVDFDQRYSKLQQFDMVLPQGVQAFFLLKAANMTSESEKLARAVAKLEYNDMREKLMKIFGDPGVLSNTDEVPEVKDVLYGESYDRNRWGRGGQQSGGQQSGGGRGRGRGFYRENSSTSGYAARDGSTRDSNGRAGGFDRSNWRSSPARCYECDSTKHFANKCPHRSTRKKEDVEMNVHIALLTATPQGTLLSETFGKMLLDSGCSKTVAGKIWLDEITETMSQSDKEAIVEKPSMSMFRFGDGVENKSIKVTTIPIYIGKTRIMLDVEIVDKKIPLLLSRAAMKQLCMTIDFRRDQLSFNQEEMKLECTSAGHYAIPVAMTHTDRHNANFVFSLECLSGIPRSEKLKKALKIHRQFSHASKEKLVKLLKNGGCEDAEFLECIAECCDKCETCQHFKKPPLKPIVAFPAAGQFNELVCMDLKEHVHTKVWILHLIDAASRYSAACLIKSKRKEVVVAAIFRIWITYFGCPAKFLSDNGGEFGNDVFREMNEKLGVVTETTAAESPFSNGIVERHNGILYEAMMKTIKDTACDADMALAWAVSAKNALQNASGYSPNQLVFGRNTNMPTVLTDLPPALENTTASDIVRKNLEALHAARKNFIEAESSERVRRALRHKVRSYADQHYESGQKVFYRREGVKGWRGPGTVIGVESKCVLVRHGAAIYRCHPCHLMRVDSVASTRVEDKPAVQTAAKKSSSKSARCEEESDSDDDTRHEETIEHGGGSSNLDHDAQDDPPDEEETAETTVSSVQQMDGDDSHEGSENDNHDEIESVGASSEQQTSGEESDSDQVREVTRPKPKSYVEYSYRDGQTFKAKVLSQQPKRTKHNGNWMNIHKVGEETPSGVDWDDVVYWREIETPETVVLLTEAEELECVVMEAKQKEIAKLQENSVYEVVAHENQTLISCRWVITEKENSDGAVCTKARLVARGFEEKSSNRTTDSPTCSKQALRMVFLTAATKQWEIHSLDISSAFLQGNGIARDVFLKPPAEFAETGKVWKLNRCIYGLNDAPRAWYDRVKEELSKLDGRMSKYDNALFSWYDSDGQLEGVMALHVDDFEFCGTTEWQKRVVGSICAMFRISAYHKGTFKYVGLNIAQTKDAVMVDQHQYVEKIKELPIDPQRRKERDEPLTAEEVSSLRSASGQLLWAATQTRPDTAHDACMVANYGKEPSVQHLIAANKAIRKMRSQKACIMFPNLGEPEQFEVIVYSDASHANLPSGASQGACILFVAGNNRIAPVHWQSKKLARVPKSSLAAETLMIAEAGDNGVFTASMLKELFALQEMPTVRILTDSRSFCDHLQSTHVLADTRMRVDMARIREMLQVNEIRVSWVPAEQQLADSLTKHGASPARLLEVLRSGRL